ncbi:MAG: hypothetical protein GKS00_10220 [Alphaproteobacteria bacterium]|nr:hypothetical protein [Alphaproteobacteria bacterium]
MIRRSALPFIVIGIATFAVVAWYARFTWLELGNPSIVTGYTLLVLMLMLGFFNIRKRLSMVPVGRTSLLLAFHVAAGLLAIALFWLHTGTLWPTGSYERILAVLFYLVSLTGILGYIILRSLPRRLTQTGIEVVYERIPAELGEIREKVEALTLECTEKTGSDTVAQHYIGTLNWFFRRPRFGLSHLVGGDAAGHWLRGPGGAARRYLNDVEKEYFDQILELGTLKILVDRHYACQDLMKKWLLVHVPLSMAVILVSIWHLLLVNVYAI